MYRKFLKSKIHKAYVTHADLEYEGSVTIPEDILELSSIKEFESVEIWNVTNGNRLSTYAIKGERNSAIFCVNGAAAHLCKPEDVIIIASFGYYDEIDVLTNRPKIIFMDENNKIKSISEEIPGPKIRI